MDSEKDKYTVQDWLESKEPNYKKKPLSNQKHVQPWLLKIKGLIDNKTFDQIIDLQKEAFCKAIKIDVEVEKQRCWDEIKKADDENKKRIIQILIKDFKKWLENHPKEEKKVLQNEWSGIGIDGKKVRRIKEIEAQGDNESLIHLSMIDQSETTNQNKPIRNKLHEAYVKSEAIKWLKKLMIEKEPAPTDSEDIFKRYWHYFKDIGLKQEKAYEKIEKWLLNDKNYTRKEVKEHFNITLNYESFTRSARNHRPFTYKE